MKRGVAAATCARQPLGQAVRISGAEALHAHRARVLWHFLSHLVRCLRFRGNQRRCVTVAFVIRSRPSYTAFGTRRRGPIHVSSIIRGQRVLCPGATPNATNFLANKRLLNSWYPHPTRLGWSPYTCKSRRLAGINGIGSGNIAPTPARGRGGCGRHVHVDGFGRHLAGAASRQRPTSMRWAQKPTMA